MSAFLFNLFVCQVSSELYFYALKFIMFLWPNMVSWLLLEHLYNGVKEKAGYGSWVRS